MLVAEKVLRIIRLSYYNLQASVEIDERSITVDLNQDRPFVDSDAEMLDSMLKAMGLDSSYVYRSAGYHYYIREEAFE